MFQDVTVILLTLTCAAGPEEDDEDDGFVADAENADSSASYTVYHDTAHTCFLSVCAAGREQTDEDDDFEDDEEDDDDSDGGIDFLTAIRNGRAMELAAELGVNR
jgi:hypothetical protein